MGIFNKKIKQLQESDLLNANAKAASDVAVDLIRGLGGEEVSLTGVVADNYVVFTNASGGTGVSTLVSNVAYQASLKGLKTLVIDLNILYPIQHTFFGIKTSVTEKPDLVSYLNGKDALGDCIDTDNEYSLLYANNRTINDLINCNNEAAIVNFNDMMSKLRRLFDLILIDCPMRVDDDLCNNVLYYCDSIYLVWDEGLSSMANTDRFRRNMSYCGIDSFTKMRVVMNKRTNIQYSEYPFKKLNVELVETLPFDTAIIENSVKAQIFTAKARTNSKNAAVFEQKIISLTDKVLRIGGYVGKK